MGRVLMGIKVYEMRSFSVLCSSALYYAYMGHDLG